MAGYLSVAVLTGHWRPFGPRPLYDGVGPAPPYHWVTPPPSFAAANQKPAEMTGTISLEGGQPSPFNGASSEIQIVLNIQAGSFGAHAGDTAVDLRATPVDPATLGPLPAGASADGNAVRLTFEYLPSGQPAGALVHPASLSLRFPTGAEEVWVSETGTGWRALPTMLNNTSTGLYVSTEQAERGGYYVPVHRTVVPAAPGGGGSTVIVVGVVVGVVVAGVAAAEFGWRRRRRSRAPAARRPAPPGRSPAPPPRRAPPQRRKPGRRRRR